MVANLVEELGKNAFSINIQLAQLCNRKQIKSDVNITKSLRKCLLLFPVYAPSSAP